MELGTSTYKPARFQKFNWSIARFGDSIMGNVLSIFVILYYLEEVLTQPSNFDALLVTMITFSAKLSEGLMNVPVARISDNIRTRWGRRRPFLLLAPVWSFFFILVFWCPFTEDQVPLILLWLLISYGGFRWSNAAVINPHLALLPEIAPEKHQRTDYQAYKTIFQLSGTIIGVLIFPILRGIVATIMGIDNRTTAVIATIPLGIIAFLGMMISFFGIRENENASLTHFGMIESFKTTFKNNSFFPSYLATAATVMLAEAMLLAAIPMIGVNAIGLQPDDIMVSLLSGLFVITAIGVVPLIVYISKRVGKARLFYYCFLFFGVFSWLTILIGQIPIITPINTIQFTPIEGGYELVTSPDWRNFVIIQTLLTVFLVGIPVGGVILLQYSVFADVIDVDEEMTGQRRESMYFASQGVVDWFFAACGDLMLGILLFLFGREYYSSTIATEAGIFGTGPLGLLLTGPVAGTILILGAFMFRRYPLMEGKEKK
ncbi:MAG: MFS transporter [Candidatus Heimdallarchaeota archaeon]|nr:MAG: MFS transporter [Candidatus Heimdallarchaeota archaeon]